MGYHEHIWFHQCQEDINSLYHFERIPGNIPAAYVSLESELIRYIKYHVNHIFLTLMKPDMFVIAHHKIPSWFSVFRLLTALVCLKTYEF
jgi:hypothetical protein